MAAAVEAIDHRAARVQQQLVSGTEKGVQMVSKSDAEAAAKDAGLAPREVDAVVDSYSDAQIQALKQALFVAAAFVLIGFWFARHLPGEPLPSEEEGEAHPKRMRRPEEPAPSLVGPTEGGA